jgi:hypothetical protein
MPRLLINHTTPFLSAHLAGHRCRSPLGQLQIISDRQRYLVLLKSYRYELRPPPYLGSRC